VIYNSPARACVQIARLLKPADCLRGLRHKWTKRRICTAEFGLGALNEIVARHQRAVERAGQGFEPASAFTVEPITANSRQVSPMSPSTTGP
jgi:hypothetical protein